MEDGTLLISNAQLSDIGKYFIKCTGGTCTRARVYMRVRQSPVKGARILRKITSSETGHTLTDPFSLAQKARRT